MQQKWFILSAVACGTFMATLDSSIVNVALPSITAALHTNLAMSRWVVIAYLFSITGLLLFFGKLADVIGRKLVFFMGFFTFTVGSFLCGVSFEIQQLIISRGIQGLGSAMLMANGPAIITAAFPAGERGKALGTLAMVVSAGLAVGPTIGGFMVRFLSWPSIFWVNLPLGVLGMILVSKFIPPALGMHFHGSEREHFEHALKLNFFKRIKIYFLKLQTFDWLGTFMWMFIQLGYSLAIDQENVLGISGPLRRLLSFASLALFFLFILWEMVVKDPVLEMALFRSKVFLHANLSGFLSVIATSSIMLLMPFYFQNVKGLPPDQVGLLMTSIPLTIFFVAPMAGRLSDKYGSKLLSSTGMFLLSGTMFLLSLELKGLVSESSYELIPYLVAIGCGIALFQAPNNNLIMSSVPKNNLGVASALLATVRNFGLVTGSALCTTLLMFFYKKQVELNIPNASSAQNFITAMRTTYGLLSIICAFGVISSLTCPIKRSNHQ